MTVRIICIGNTTLDKVWPVWEFPSTGGKYRASDYLEFGGGMAANAAVAAARLGGNAAYWGRAGDDAAGHVMKNEMAGFGVDVSHFQLFHGARSSISAVLVANDGERAIINFRGADLPDNAAWLPLDRIKDAQAVLADIRWLEGACAVYSAARSLNIPTVLDGEIANQSAFTTVLPLVDHAIFSESGLRSFIGVPVLNRTQYPDALKKVRTWGCKVAAVTQGEHGILWLDDEGLHEQESFPVEVVDTTGAGDVFHGAYTFALAERRSVADAMRFASAVAALKCTRQGGRAGIPTRAEVNAFMTVPAF
ncbi:MAG: sugar kinase [Burkholderiaceae bacterium]